MLLKEISIHQKIYFVTRSSLLTFWWIALRIMIAIMTTSNKPCFFKEPQGILEEIESTSKLDDLKIIPVSSSTLSKKLKPVRVSDPFLAKFDKQLDLLRWWVPFSRFMIDCNFSWSDGSFSFFSNPFFSLLSNLKQCELLVEPWIALDMWNNL